MPLYNEQASLPHFHGSLVAQLDRLEAYDFEILYCNDGSRDTTLDILQGLAERDKRLRIISLSRNFGKEMATTAGIHAANGAAIIMIDADGQHPVELIAELIGRWQAGKKVVVGRTTNRQASLVKRSGSRLFYGLFSRLTGMKLLPGATDFRLIDRAVQADFVRMTEHNRITRGLIDWLGYERDYVPYREKARMHGTAGYSFKKIFKLAIDSAISLSSSPLYITAYIGAVVLPVSALLGLVMVVDKLVGDPLNWQASGGAYVLVLVLFLVGILLMSQGIIGLYLSHIHSETQNRPLYIIDESASSRL